MKRKRRYVKPAPLVDSLVSLSATLEAIESPVDEIVAVRDFSGVPYHMYTTKNAIRFDLDMLRYMITSRESHIGRRSFVGPDGRLLAVDVHQCQWPHSVWSYDTDGPHLLENLAEEN
jgi:hypothetical protein